MSDAANLKIQQQINEAIAERGKLLAAQTKQISDQAELAIAFCKAMKCEDIDRVSERVNQIKEGLTAAAKAAEEQAASVSGLSGELDKALKSADELKNSQESQLKITKGFIKVAKQIGEVFFNSFKKGIAGVKGLTNLISSTATGILNIGQALLAIPLKIFDIMTDKAAELANASRVIAEAIEDVREQYGDVNKGLSKQVIDGGKDMGDSLGEAGLSISRVFGMGPEGVAAAIRESLDIAKSLGPVVGLLGEKFGKAAGDLVVFKKGLGLTNEDMKAVIMQSKAMGKNFRTEFLKMSKIANDMGDKFSSLGISSKDIARDMAYLTTSSGKFGRVTKEAMAAASVTVRSYGLELKDVVGVLDQFADFESAATNASKFAQSFGTILDPIKLMKEENPAKAFEYLRDQMLAAGQSAETMNKAQIKQLATLSGMDENNVRLAFSNKNVGKSYEEIQRAAEKSGKKQKSQQEIMQDLGKDIKRVVEAIQHSGSLLTEFFSGFGEGISRSERGRKVLYDLASLLRGMRILGREVGKVFVNAFPGVGKMFDGLHKLLTGKDGMGNLITNLREAFDKLFKALKSNPAEAVKEFFIDVKKMFAGGEGLSMISEGFDEFKSAISGIFAGLLEVVIENLAMGLNELAKIIANPDEYLKSAGGFADSFFKPIIESLQKSLPKLLDSLKNLIVTALFKYGPTITAALGSVFAVYFGSALAFGILKVAVTTGFTVFMQALGTMLLSALTATAVTPPPGAMLRVNVFIAELKTVLQSLKSIPAAQLAIASAIILGIVGAVGLMMYGMIELATAAAAVPPGGIENVTKILIMTMTVLAGAVAVLFAGAAIAAGSAALGPAAAAAAAALGIAALLVIAMGAFAALVNTIFEPAMLDGAAKKMTSLSEFMLQFTVFAVLLAAAAVAATVAAGAAVAFGALTVIGAALLAVGWPVLLAGFTAAGKAAAALSNIAAGLIEHMREIVDSINSINFDVSKIGAFASLLVSLVTATGGIMAASLMAAPLALPLLAGLNVIEKFLDTIKEKTPGIIKSLLAAVKNIPAESLGPKVSAVTDTLEAIMGLIEPLSIVGKILDNPKANELLRNGAVTGIGDILESVSSFIAIVGEQAKTIVDKMINLVKDVPEKTLSKVETVVKVMKALADVVSPITSMATSLLQSKEKGPQVSMASMKKTLEFSAEFITTLAESKMSRSFATIVKIADSFKIGSVGALGKKFDLIGRSFEIINRSTEMFTKFSDPVALTNLIIGTHNSSAVFTKLADSINSAEYKNLMAAINSAPQISSKNSAALERSFDSMLAITNKMGQISGRVDKINEAYGFAIYDTLGESVYSLIELSDLLADIKVGDIDTIIDSLASDFKIQKKNIQVENKPVHIHMNLNVQFDALKFTNSVFTVASNAVKMEAGDFRNRQDQLARTNRDTASAVNGLLGKG